MWIKNGALTTPSQATLDTFATTVGNAFGTAWQAGAGTFCHYDKCDLTYFSGGGEGLKSSALEGLIGTGGASGLTNATALCLSWPISALYRGGHPRTYLAGVPENEVVNLTTFDSTYLNGVISRFTTFRSTINAVSSGALGSVQLGTVSFQHDKAWRSPPVFRPYVGAPFADTRIDTQRRRLGPDR